MTTLWALRIFGPTTIPDICNRVTEDYATVSRTLVCLHDTGYARQLRNGVWDVTDAGRTFLSGKPPVEVRGMFKGDLKAVLNIERWSYSPPWTEAEMIAELRSHGVRGTVALINEQVVGFAIVLKAERSMRILSLAVNPEWRRHGVGRALVQDMIALQQPDTPRLVIDLPFAHVAMAFFQTLGFHVGFAEEGGECARLVREYSDVRDMEAVR